MRTVYCEKLKKDAEGLGYAPLPGELGEKIFNHISAEAWQLWLKQQTMLINEHRLNLMAPETRAFLQDCMVRFLFKGEEITPANVTPPTKSG